jgi:hypothetical protein
MTTNPLDQHTGLWVTVDVIAIAFNVGTRHVYKLATTHKWRRRPGHYPRQYAFADVRATYKNYKKGNN